ncbi:MAG: hypothetical protein ACRCX7_11395 [Cetobacterium sp.]|uniref:hypothetical protein n=1 Tax=Cetobacterium sp. TaxID=2071632 RepID=UPI003F2F4115
MAGIIYSEKGVGMPTGVRDFVIGDIVRVPSFFGDRLFEIAGFSIDEEPSETDTLIRLLSDVGSHGFTVGLEGEAFKHGNYTTMISPDIKEYFGTEQRFMWWESYDFDIYEKYVSQFWQL